MPNNTSASVCITQPGFAHYRNELFRELARRYPSLVVIYTTSEATYPGRIDPAGYEFSFSGGSSGLRWFGLFRQLVKKRPQTVVSSRAGYFESIVSRFYCVLFRKHHVVWVLEWRLPENSGSLVRRALRRIRAELGRYIIRSADAVIAMGSQAKGYVLSAGKPEHSIFSTINCSEDVGAGIVRQSNSSQPTRVNILYLSRILEWKGLDVLIQAFSRLEKEKDVHLLIAGDGPFRPECEKLAKDLGVINIQFEGSVDPSERKEYFRKADLFVLPSCLRENSYEAWGLVINEAMSASLPIVTTDAVGAAYDLVQTGENGFIAENGRIDSLYNALTDSIKQDLNAMGLRSREIFEEKNRFQDVADKFSSAILDAVNSV